MHKNGEKGHTFIDSLKVESSEKRRVLFLYCGILAPILYFLADMYAGYVYPGYSFTSQAISELFAIGAPTSGIVVSIFTVSSLLLLMFSLGVWRSSSGNRAVKITALMFVGNAVNGLILWNIYPMHMRGDTATFTDLMHIILAGVGVVFILLAVLTVILSSDGLLRIYSIIALMVLLIPGAIVFITIPGLKMGEPTPYIGLTERISTYGYYLWQFIYIKHLIPSRFM
jgi:hypothetical membrane protein